MLWLLHFVRCAFGVHEWSGKQRVMGIEMTFCKWCDASKTEVLP